MPRWRGVRPTLVVDDASSLLDHRRQLLVCENRVGRQAVLIGHRLPQRPELRENREIRFGENFPIVDTLPLPLFRRAGRRDRGSSHRSPRHAGTIGYEMTFHLQHTIRRQKAIQVLGFLIPANHRDREETEFHERVPRR